MIYLLTWKIGEKETICVQTLQKMKVPNVRVV